MRSPYGMELLENCSACNLCSEGFFCHLPDPEMEAFRKIKFTLAHPAGAMLFVEGQECRGIYILCKGWVKLSATSSDGQTLIMTIAKPGEVLGLNASICGTAHNLNAETRQPCQLNFVRQADFLQFLKEYGNACLQAATHLSFECQQSYHRLRSLAMHSASERIARLMLDLSDGDFGLVCTHGIKVVLTQEEIGQIIGMSRETVSRTLAGLRQQHIAEIHDSTLLVHDMPALQGLAR